MITQHYHNDRLLTNKQSHQIFHITSRSKYNRNIKKIGFDEQIFNHCKNSSFLQNIEFISRLI